MNFTRKPIARSILSLALTALPLVPSPADAFPLFLLVRGAAVRGAAAGSAVRAAPAAAAARASAPARVAAAPRVATARPAASAAAAAPRAVAKPVPAASAAARPPGKPYDVVVSKSRYPASAEHVRHAQRLGQPSVLTLERSGAAQRRAEALRYIKDRSRRPGAHFDRDEYPMAIFREGGNPASVRYIHRSDNRGAGRSVGHQLRDVPDGARVRFMVGE